MSDQLKHFADRLPATFVYAGIEVEAQGLFAGVHGRQIAGRFTLIGATPFAYGTTEQRAAWRSLVSTLEAMLQLHKHDPGTLVALDEYLYRRTGGMIGSLSQLIRGAAILAIEDGTDVANWESRSTPWSSSSVWVRVSPSGGGFATAVFAAAASWLTFTLIPCSRRCVRMNSAVGEHPNGKSRQYWAWPVR